MRQASLLVLDLLFSSFFIADPVSLPFLPSSPLPLSLPIILYSPPTPSIPSYHSLLPSNSLYPFLSFSTPSIPSYHSLLPSNSLYPFLSFSTPLQLPLSLPIILYSPPTPSIPSYHSLLPSNSLYPFLSFSTPIQLPLSLPIIIYSLQLPPNLSSCRPPISISVFLFSFYPPLHSHHSMCPACYI